MIFCTTLYAQVKTHNIKYTVWFLFMFMKESAFPLRCREVGKWHSSRLLFKSGGQHFVKEIILLRIKVLTPRPIFGATVRKFGLVHLSH